MRRPALRLVPPEAWHPPALELITTGGRGRLVTYVPRWLYRRFRPPS